MAFVDGPHDVKELRAQRRLCNGTRSTHEVEQRERVYPYWGLALLGTEAPDTRPLASSPLNDWTPDAPSGH